MASNSCITHINSALDDLKLLEENHRHLQLDRKVLKTFLLCARKWCRDPVISALSEDRKSKLKVGTPYISLEALLARIQDVISKMGEYNLSFYPYGGDLDEESDSEDGSESIPIRRSISPTVDLDEESDSEDGSEPIQGGPSFLLSDYSLNESENQPFKLMHLMRTLILKVTSCLSRVKPFVLKMICCKNHPRDDSDSDDFYLTHSSLLSPIHLSPTHDYGSAEYCYTDYLERLRNEPLPHMGSKTGEDSKSIQRAINEWYAVFSDCSSRQFSNTLINKDELMEFMDSLLDNLVQFPDWSEFETPLIATLVEKLMFLKNFMSFVTERGVEDRQLRPLLIHTEAAAVSAGHLSFLPLFTMKADQCSDMVENVSELLQKIVPVEPQVQEICVQALIAAKFSTQSYGDTQLRNFVDSLLCFLWEVLKSGDCIVINLKVRLQMVYEGLRSLRNILKEKPKKFDEKMRVLAGSAVCDVGILISTLSVNAMRDRILANRVGFGCSDLLEIIKLIQSRVLVEKCPGASMFNYPRTSELSFIHFLTEEMMDLAGAEAGSNALANHPVQIINEELVYLHSFLGKIVEMHTEDEELQALWDRVVEVAYRVEFLIDSLLVGDILDDSSMSFSSILEEIKIIKAEVLKISESKRLELEVEAVTKKFSHMPLEGGRPIVTDVVVGFEDEAASIITRLIRGSPQLQIVPIVGMPGLGKTTLANKVYNEAAVTSHFYARAWCFVSQVYDKKNMLLEILTCVLSKLPATFSAMSEEDLMQEVYRRLKRNRFLIILDDVWDIEAWSNLEAAFPNDANGSRIVLTSRLCDIAPLDQLDKEPHALRRLTDDESWLLLKEKLFTGKGMPPKLCELRTQILEMCQGVPLTIVILAGLLANMDQHGWKAALQSLSSSIVSSTEQCTATLELSYKNLPDQIKPCFLYFGALPKGHNYVVDRLIWLWVAEGFARKTQFKSSEDVAYDYMMDLIGRSLVMVSQQRSIGGVKTCRVHDLLHEFCLTKVKEEKFLQMACGFHELSTISVPHNLRRLCINSQAEDFCKSRLFSPTVRCLLFFAQGERHRKTESDISIILRAFRLVKVLDLSQIHLGDTFPRELEMLIHLRYLAILGSMNSIPLSIDKLLNLETFVLQSHRMTVSLPYTIWNLKKLRHLQMKDKLLIGFGFLVPVNHLLNSPHLYNLDTFSNAILSWENAKSIFKKFPNIRQLKCKISECRHRSEKVLVLDFLTRLESLNLNFNPLHWSHAQQQIEFRFSATIKKLTLSGFRLPWSKMSAIANLPNLGVLKLLEQAFVGETWNMEIEEFPELRFLKLSSLDIVKWIVPECENCFPRLQKLVLESCYYLKEIPSSLGNVPNLETIQVSGCPYSSSSLKQIQEEQISMGNFDLKILA